MGRSVGKKSSFIRWLPVSRQVLSTLLATGTCFALVLALVVGVWGLQNAEASPLAKGRVGGAYRNLPLYFELNRGQSDGRVKFLSRGSGYSLFLTPTELVLHVKESESQVFASTMVRGHRSVREVLKVRLEGLRPRQKRGSVIRIKQAVLKGVTYSGSSFTGTDSIRIVPTKSK